MLKLSQPVYVQGLFKIVVVIFFAGLCIYEAMVFWYYSVRYHRAAKSIESYQGYLKRINEFYETEESDSDYTVIELSDEESAL